MARVDSLFYSRSYRKCFQFFNIKNICYGFVTYGLHYIDVGSLYEHFLYSFSSQIAAECCHDHMTFILHFSSMMYHGDWFTYIEESLHSRNTSYLTMLFDPFNVLLDSVCCCWILYSSVILAVIFFFVCVVLLAFFFFFLETFCFVLFWYQGVTGPVEWTMEYTFPWNFLDSFRSIGFSSSLNV